jgi:hypothetical protein
MTQMSCVWLKALAKGAVDYPYLSKKMDCGIPAKIISCCHGIGEYDTVLKCNLQGRF